MKFDCSSFLLAPLFIRVVFARINPSRGATEEKSHHVDKVALPLPKAIQDGFNVDDARSTLGFETRIVGGRPVSNPQTYPFFVSWGGQCGGSLINSDIVLTAAHCADVFSSRVTVNAYKTGDPNTPGAEIRSVVEKSPHPDYNTVTLANDVMVLKLNSPVTSASPIKLNTDTSIPRSGQNVTVIGLGLTSENGPQTTYLREVTLNTLSDRDCNTLYGGAIRGESMFCARTEGGDSCQGDSGGPAFTMTPSGAFDKQIGVVSWGYGCARPTYPGVYADVSSVSDWISAEVCRLSVDKPSDCEGETLPPTLRPPEPDESRVLINIVTDRFPSEAGWYILDASGSTIESVAAGTYDKPETLYTKEANLVKGASYTFVMTDSSGDGMCCLYGNGEYYVEADGNVLVSGSSFGSSESTTFTVPLPGTPQDPPTNPPIGTTTPSTPRPTPRPTPNVDVDTPAPTPSLSGPSNGSCEDSSGTITLDDTAEKKDCSWLGVNKDRYGYLCQFVDVAALCPATCQMCSLFG